MNILFFFGGGGSSPVAYLPGTFSYSLQPQLGGFNHDFSGIWFTKLTGFVHKRLRWCSG